jgi:hypothetical protein
MPEGSFPTGLLRSNTGAFLALQHPLQHPENQGLLNQAVLA